MKYKLYNMFTCIYSLLCYFEKRSRALLVAVVKETKLHCSWLPSEKWVRNTY